MLIVGQLDQEIGLFAPALGIQHRSLFFVVIELDQAAHLQRLLKLGLTPATPFLRITLERFGQVFRVTAHFQSDFEYLLDFALQQGIAFDRLTMHIVDAFLKALDLFAKRFQQGFERILVSLVEGAGLVVKNLVGEILELNL